MQFSVFIEALQGCVLMWCGNGEFDTCFSGRLYDTGAIEQNVYDGHATLSNSRKISASETTVFVTTI